MKRSQTLPLAVLLGTGWLTACSSSPSELASNEFETPDDGSTLDAGSDVSTDGRLDAGPEGSIISPEGSTNQCPSQILCGASGQCCPLQTECVQGECAAKCESGVRCGAQGSVCCASGQVCLSESCVDPGASCNDSYDCDEGLFCEPTLGRCLPQPQGSALCEYRPPTLPFNAMVEWSWTSSSIHPEAVQVINMPVVVDLDRDAIPDVVIVTSDNYDQTKPGFLRALDGRTGQEKWAASADVYQSANQVNPRGTPAAADIDGDGIVDIVVPMRAGGVLAFNADGSLKWRSTLADGSTPYREAMNSVTVAIANMDHDGSPEIVVGGVVLDAQGRVRSGQGRGFAGSNAQGYGAVSLVADVDMDGIQDVVTGAAAYRIDGSTIWSNGQSDGYPAITDFEGDGQPELVVISQSTVRVQNASTGQVLATGHMPAEGNGGPPTIADFDADGQMEISSANGGAYAVFDYSGQPSPALSLKWSRVTQDLSSNVTGSSVFDFEGDGAAEVVYGDECFFRVYSGQDGTVLYETPSSSATIHEYPVVVDVDGDNNTEVVVVSNDVNHASGGVTCPTYQAGVHPRHGVFVYGDANDKWVRTRRIWNQHAYHITNINADGSLPASEPPSWVRPQGFNNYRVSTQGSGVYNAPDLQVDLELSSASCPEGLELRARVKNAGALGVPPGVVVTFFLGTSGAGTPLGQKSTEHALLPGQSEIVSQLFTIGDNQPPFQFFVTVDGASASSGLFDECVEDNNSASAGGVECPQIR